MPRYLTTFERAEYDRSRTLLMTRAAHSQDMFERQELVNASQSIKNLMDLIDQHESDARQPIRTDPVVDILRARADLQPPPIEPYDEPYPPWAMALIWLAVLLFGVAGLLTALLTARALFKSMGVW